MRYLAGRVIELTHTFEADDGTVLEPFPVTCTVTSQAGTVVATGGAGVLDAVYKFTPSPALTQGVYTVRWASPNVSDTTSVEVVGSLLFTHAELRRSDPDLTAARFPNDVVRRVRDLVSQEFETITGRSFTARTVRAPWLTGEPLPRLDVSAATVYDSAGDPVPAGALDTVGPFSFLPDVTTDAIYSVELDYGLHPTPDDVRQAAILRARTLLFDAGSGIPDRVTSFQPGDGGTYILSTAGRRGATTGIPDVDAVLARYSLPLMDAVGGFW